MFVGGCVRKYLEKENIDDIDIATILTIEQLKECFKDTKIKLIETGIDHGSVTIINGDYKFEIGKSIQLREGKDVTIFSAGAMVYNCLEAAKKLKEKNISCSVINMHTIKPIDKEAINKASNESKIIVSVEEHNIIGGLGSAIAEYKATLSNSPKQVIIGVDDTYSKGGSYTFLQEKHGLTSDKIVDNILQNLK